MAVVSTWMEVRQIDTPGQVFGCPWPTLAGKVGMTLIPAQFYDSALQYVHFHDFMTD